MDETFNVGPDDKYQFKSYQNDRDEMAWEWWSWYGDRDGTEETHPNNWIFRLGGDSYQPREIAYFGQATACGRLLPAEIDSGPTASRPLTAVTTA